MRQNVQSLTGLTAVRGAVLAAALFVIPGCGSAGVFTWYRDLPHNEFQSSSGEYVIGIGDTVRVQVYDQEGLTVRSKIRPDGRLALPFVGEVVAVGRHPLALAKEIEARLKEFFVTPRVTVTVEESVPVTISVLGEVGHVGLLTLEPNAGLLQALAQAGGPTDYADKSSIYVLRRSPDFRRIRFTYDSLLQNREGAATFSLRTGDVLVVE
jgi:polysaccharide export outer membrane protein